MSDRYVMGVTVEDYNELEFLRMAAQHMYDKLHTPIECNHICDMCIFIGDYIKHGEIPDKVAIEHMKSYQ